MDTTSKFWSSYQDEYDDDLEGDIYTSGEEFDDDFDSEVPQKHSKFAKDDFSDDEDEEETEKVLSGTEKKYQELQGAIKSIKSKISNDDWNAIVTEWAEFTKKCDKLNPLFLKNGIPAFLVIFLASLEDSIQDRTSNAEFKKKYSTTKVKAITTLKKLLKKWIDGRQDISTKLVKYREDPDSINEEEDSFKSSEASTKKKKVAEVATGRDKWLKQPGDYSSSSDDEDDMFSDDDFDDDVKVTKAKKKRGKVDRPKKEKVALEDRFDSTEKQEDWTPERIDTKTKELLDRRGTKNYDRLEQAKLFELLIEKSKELPFSIERYLRLNFHLINAQFDASPNMAVHMTIPMWKRCFNNIVRVLDVLQKNKDSIRLVDGEPNPESDIIEIRSPLLSQIERLHDEFMKSLQAMDEYTQDYVNRLKHESGLLKLTKAVFDFYVDLNEPAKVAALASRRLDHLYYKREVEGAIKSDDLKTEQEKINEQKNEKDDSSVVQDVDDESLTIPNVPEDKNLTVLVPELCRIIYRTNDEDFPDIRYGRAFKTRAILQHIYHLALHDQYYEARDMMLMTRMFENVNSTSDPAPKILYNRALVQIGLAAFRKGLFAETQIHLADFMSSNKYREWLAQGVYKTSEKTPEEERIERLRQVPYPMFINLELLEFAHLTSSMLHDVTNIFLNDSDKKKSSGGSKGFKKILDQAEKNLSGPPESIRENIVAATNALKEGDWKKSSHFLLNLDVWKTIHNSECVKSILETRIKEESLRAYVLTNSNFYVSVSLDMLSSMFELPQNKIHSLLCKMIINGEFSAHWDGNLKCYVARNNETTYLNQLIRQMGESVGSSEGLRGNLKDKEIMIGGKKIRRQ